MHVVFTFVIDASTGFSGPAYRHSPRRLEARLAELSGDEEERVGQMDNISRRQ